MIKDIITDVEALSERSDEVNIRKEGDIQREIVLALKDTIRDKNLVCLAAPQIGYSKRIFVINFNGDLKTFINPILSDVSGVTLAKETCDSIPGKTFLRIRHSTLVATYQDPLGKIKSYKMAGLNAIVFQRMVDMLDGLLLSDVGLEIDDNFEKAPEEERMEVINAYLDSLDLRQKEVEKEIEDNPELKRLKDASDFLEGVQKGEIKLGEAVTVNKEGEIKKEKKK